MAMGGDFLGRRRARDGSLVENIQLSALVEAEPTWAAPSSICEWCVHEFVQKPFISG